MTVALENHMVIGDYYPGRHIPDEDRMHCSECGAVHSVYDLGDTIVRTCFGALCKSCRIWCQCGDVLVSREHEMCDFCAYEAMGGEELAERWYMQQKGGAA